MKKEITILEDNTDLRELYTIILNEEGYHVREFENIATFKENDIVPELFILDVMLPDGNGMDVCEVLKSNPRYAHVPVIMMSAHMDKGRAMAQCQAEDFIGKPFDIGFLIERVAILIN
jgi:DNA-binding response OmpR family regulator